MGFGVGQKPFIDAGCKVNNCIATSDRSLLKESDGVIIHAGDYSENDLPTYRSPRQRFIFFNLETLPGLRHLPCFSRRNFYNYGQ
jgi:alpha-1,3-fucosyltransferase